jgi:integrase
MVETDTRLVPVPAGSTKLNKTARQLATIKGAATAATERYVPHVSLEDIQRLCQVAASTGRPSLRERNVLIIQCLYDSCLRVSELLALRPKDIELVYNAYYLRVWNQKRRRYETCNITAPMAAKLQAYAYRHKIEPDDRLFTINRTRVFQMIAKTFKQAGIVKPDGVGTVHILRHSGALERLRQTKHPQSVQEQLRHSSMAMTLRYMRTLAHDDAMAIQSEVNYEW